MAIATFQLFLSASARQAAMALRISASVRQGLLRMVPSKMSRVTLSLRHARPFYHTSGRFLRLRLGAAIGLALLLAGLLVDRCLHPAAVIARGTIRFHFHRFACCRLRLGFFLFLGRHPAIGERREHDGGRANSQSSIQQITHGGSLLDRWPRDDNDAVQCRDDENWMTCSASV